MTAPAPWSVKGIDPRAREVAKELARREGMTLGEWLNRMIVEQDGGGAEAQPDPGRFARAQPDDPIPLEPSVRGLLGRVERSEREQIAVAARFEGLAEELRNDQMRLAERIHRMEQSGEGYGSTEALRALEQTVGRLASHVYETETTSQDAMRDLGACFVKLDGRLRKVEGGHGGGASLTAELDQVRAEIATIAEAAERKVLRADAVHAQALERLGSEVARISERLAERIANAERRGSMAVDEVSEQVSRVAERIHQRQERAAEDVTDRIRQAEERMARLLEETRAQVEASFAAARGREPAASATREFIPFSEAPNFADPEPLPDEMLSTREVIEGARAAAGIADAPRLVKRKEGFSLFGSRKKKGSSSTTLQTALFVTGTAAALGAGVASYMLGVAEPSPSTVSVDNQPAVSGEPRLAIALDPQPADSASAPAVKPHLQKAADLYAEAVKMLKAKDWGGVDKLKAAAALGYPPAQFHLARLYESGGHGVVKDEVEARRWTEQAARGGEAKAMHNLALYYYEGTGAGKDPVKAAEWFRRAADLGLTDSQYNLGRLYEDGVGVAKDPAAAYHWYSLAARSGDADAKASADRMALLLTPDARAAVQTR